MDKEKQPKVPETLPQNWTEDQVMKEAQRLDKAVEQMSKNLKEKKYPSLNQPIMETQVNELIYHPWALIRLEWMQDNSPELLRDQYQEGILKERVERKVQIAIEQKNFMIEEQKVNPNLAEELAIEIVAPADEINLDNNNQMPDKEFQLILEQLLG